MTTIASETSPDQQVAGANPYDVLPHECMYDVYGTWVNFSDGWNNGDLSKLRDSHVIGLLSNREHVDKHKVTHITLRDCKGITDNSLVFIADHFPQLEKIWINKCDLVTDNGIIAISEKCPKLRYLDFSYCYKVGNTALEAIVSNLPLLELLLAESCNISVLPDDFGYELKHLKWLNLSCNKITTLPASIYSLASLHSCQTLDFKNNPILLMPSKKNLSIKIDSPNKISKNSIIKIDAPTTSPRIQAKHVECSNRFYICFTLALLIYVFFIPVFFIVGSIFLPFAIQKQRIANGVDPMKQFNVIDSNCIIVEVSHIVNGRQKRCETKDSYTDCGCEDVYLYLFSLPQTQQHIESTNSIAGIEIESETHVYQSIEHAIERRGDTCRNSDVPMDPNFDVGQETHCWRPAPRPLESEAETLSKLPDAYKCGNDLCLKVFDPQNDADVIYHDAKLWWTVVGSLYGVMVFMCFTLVGYFFFS